MDKRAAMREAHQLARDVILATVRNEYDPSLSDEDQARVNAALTVLADRHRRARERLGDTDRG